jgi:LmbE family N-acetylglucosaminyl deacetylase
MYPDARNPFAFAEEIGELEAWSVAETWIGGSERANHYVDVTDTFETKKAALLRHESQIQSVEQLQQILEWWLGANAKAAGWPAGRYAEAFWVMNTA